MSESSTDGAAPASGSLPPWLAHAVGVLGVLTLQARLTRGTWQAWDLRLFDESWYLSWGRDIARHFDFPAWENAPLYCAYYAIFHLFTDDAFTVYFAHRTVMLLLGEALIAA